MYSRKLTEVGMNLFNPICKQNDAYIERENDINEG